MNHFARLIVGGSLVALVFSGCSTSQGTKPPGQPLGQLPAQSVEGAQAFMEQVERELLELIVHAERAAWVKMTYITHDTALLEARAQEGVMEYMARRAKEAVRYDGVKLPDKLRRKFELLKLSLTLPAPKDASKRSELAGLVSRLDAQYGTGKYCPTRGNGRCFTLGDLKETMAKSRDYGALLDAWQGWRTISPPMKSDYARLVELANEGARELGFADVAQIWKSRYDMPSESFEQEVDRCGSKSSRFTSSCIVTYVQSYVRTMETA